MELESRDSMWDIICPQVHWVQMVIYWTTILIPTIWVWNIDISGGYVEMVSDRMWAYPKSGASVRNSIWRALTGLFLVNKFLCSCTPTKKNLCRSRLRFQGPLWHLQFRSSCFFSAWYFHSNWPMLNTEHLFDQLRLVRWCTYPWIFWLLTLQ